MATVAAIEAMVSGHIVILPWPKAEAAKQSLAVGGRDLLVAAGAVGRRADAHVPGLVQPVVVVAWSWAGVQGQVWPIRGATKEVLQDCS